MKTIIQTNLESKYARSQMEVTREIINLHGIGSIFNGLGATITRGFLVNCIIFYANEKSHIYMDPYMIKSKL